jgi:hypothetical protein
MDKSIKVYLWKPVSGTGMNWESGSINTALLKKRWGIKS